LDSTLPGVNNDFRILLPAARPVKEKGHLTAVKALYRIRKSGIDAVLWLPGKRATGASNCFLICLKFLIRELKLQKYVHFIGWRDDMPAVIKACDLVVLPTHTEGFPRVILESMILKKPVCATPVGGIPEIVKHRRTGMLFPVEDDKTMADVLRELINDESLKGQLISNALAFTTSNYDASENTRIVKNVFNKYQNFS
jgi:glycosyltransferase involved in cell wall biosynthesis